MKPSKIEFEIGRDQHGRSVKLTGINGSVTNARTWTLVREAADQRDERVILDCLTDDMLKNIGEVAAFAKGGAP